jgi:putative oxidoreductase
MNAHKSQLILTDVGLLLIRVIVGVVFAFHGSQKMFGLFGGVGLAGFAGFLDQMAIPQPAVAAVLASSAELIGGNLLVLGFGIRFAVLPMIVTMGVAIFAVHGGAFSLEANGMEYALLLAVVLAGLGFTGPGRISLSCLMNNEALIRRFLPSSGVNMGQSNESAQSHGSAAVGQSADASHE